MQTAKAQKILYKNSISFVDSKVISYNTKPVHRSVYKAITALHRSGQQYFHPMHSGIYTGAKTPSITSFGTIKKLDFKKIQNKSYTLYMDSIFAQSLINTMKSFTVNHGLRLQCIPSVSVLKGVSPEKVNAFCLKAQDLWKTWTEHREADWEGDLTYNQMEAQRATHFFVFGEYFYIRRVANNKPLTLQMIDPRNVMNPSSDALFKVREAGGDIINGIEYDAQQKKVAIYVRSQKPLQPVEYIRIPIFKNGIQQVAHSARHHVDMVNTKRGLPLLALIIHELEKITDADLFELESMAVNASIAGFLQNNGTSLGAENLLQGLEDDYDIMPSDTLPYQNDNAQQYKTLQKNISRGGLVLQNLPPGVTFHSHDTRRPNVNLATYIDMKMQYISTASAGISLELVKQLFGENFSASRASNDLAWKIFDFYNKNHFAIDNQIDLELFISFYIKNRTLQAAGYAKPELRKAWLNSKWHGQSKPTFNPKQEADASKILVDESFSSREAESQKYSGTSAANNIQALIQENKALAKAKKALPQVQPQNENNNNNNNENNNENDNNNS